MAESRSLPARAPWPPAGALPEMAGALGALGWLTGYLAAFDARMLGHWLWMAPTAKMIARLVLMRVTPGLARLQDNNDPAEPDLHLKGAELGLRYSLPTDSTLTYWMRQGRGQYSGAAGSAGDFDEGEHALELIGLLSDRLRINGQLAYVEREHQQRSDRDFSGLVARAGLNWAISAKTSLGAGLVRELAAYQSSQASYFEGYRGFFAPQWQASTDAAACKKPSCSSMSPSMT